MAELFEGSTYTNHSEELQRLHELGFTINPLNQRFLRLEDAWKYAESIHTTKDTLPYMIDGVVVKLEDYRLAHLSGVIGKTPRAWAAIKFAGDDVTTHIQDIIWQVGKTGRVTPVAVLEPVILAGSVVKRATLHNYKEILDSNIHLQDMVVVHKAGDIIPEVKQILTNLRLVGANLPVIPSVCPVCSTRLIISKTEVDLLCPNPACPAQVKGRLEYYTSRGIANIVGLSDKSIEKFIELYGIADIADLYNLPYDKIQELEGYGPKSVENLRTSIEAAQQIPLAKFFAGLGIDGVGPEIARKILNNLTELQNLALSESPVQTGPNPAN